MSNILLLLVAVVICATFSLRIFQGLDEMMGEQYWVIDTAQGDHGWYGMGLLPHVKKAAKEVVQAANTDADEKNNYIIYAQNGDFAGNSVYGICLGIPLIMYLIWLAFILGFPDRIDPYLLPRRIFTLTVIVMCSIIVNLFLMRIAADFARDPMSRIANVAGNHASLLFHNAGIWFAILFSALGTPNHSARETAAPDSRNWQTQANEKFNWMFVLLFAVTVLEVALVKNKLALPDAAVDYSVWIILVVIFMRMFGFSPRYWVKRGRGIGIMIAGTLVTLPIFYLLERATGTLGAGFASPILSKALGPENANIGLSLMVSIYLIFWMEFAAAIRMNGPSKSLSLGKQ
ncbi:membrane protein [Geoanaerobacter pelophilus]|uniref:Membrane protein n=2 Tax=Geoanaerobacter pelophilus TaxID=60036 RepID=A0ABQ0MF60_9BACT|nr:membrane protein [Geoanaerobacter pelophilus]